MTLLGKEKLCIRPPGESRTTIRSGELEQLEERIKRTQAVSQFRVGVLGSTQLEVPIE